MTPYGTFASTRAVRAGVELHRREVNRLARAVASGAKKRARLLLEGLCRGPSRFRLHNRESLEARSIHGLFLAALVSADFVMARQIRHRVKMRVDLLTRDAVTVEAVVAKAAS
jgi:hypothetical protein